MTEPQATIIRHGRVVDTVGHRTDPADILVLGNAIDTVGAPGLAAPEGAREIDAGGRLLIPGLVNAHLHGHGNLTKGAGDRWTLELLLNSGPWLNGGRGEEEKYLSTLVGAVEMIRRGSTACYDLTVEFPAPSRAGMAAVGQAYRDAGMRAVVAPMVADLTLYQAIPGLLDAVPEDLRADVDKMTLAPYEHSLVALNEMLESWPFDRDWVAPALGPTIPLHCTDPFLEGCRDLARDWGAQIHMHLAESKAQAVSGLSRYGKSLTAHLDDVGVLGPNYVAAHGVWLDDDDIRRLADNGAAVAHNPGSNLRLGSGIAPARALVDAGVSVGIGTDGAQCSDNLNMFEAMRLASFVSRVRDRDYERWLGTEEALTLATEGSARVLGMAGRIGRIAPGYKADIVFLDLAAMAYVPLNDVVNQLVHADDGASVDRVMIGGRVVFENGQMTTVDEAKLRRDAEAAAERLRAANAEARRFSELLAPAVGSFCLGLAGGHA